MAGARIPRPGGAASVAVIAILIGAAGCGSSGDAGPTDSAARADRGPIESVVASHHSSTARSGTTSARDRARGRAQARRSGRSRSPSKGKSPPAHRRSGASPARSGGRCPEGVSRSTCRAMTKAAKPNGPSHPLGSPRDCVKSLSRADCENLLRAQAAAAQNSGPSYSVDDCLANPTPACKKVVGPLLEAQRGARQSGGD